MANAEGRRAAVYKRVVACTRGWGDGPWGARGTLQQPLPLYYVALLAELLSVNKNDMKVYFTYCKLLDAEVNITIWWILKYKSK